MNFGEKKDEDKINARDVSQGLNERGRVCYARGWMQGYIVDLVDRSRYFVLAV